MFEIITIVVPAYNEEDNIETTYKKLKKAMARYGDYEILFIDDGSSDNTVKIVRKIISRDKKIRLIKHEKNKGLGAAISTGFKNSRGEYVVTIDSDCTFDPKQIPSILRYAIKNNCDLTIGSPYLKREMEEVLWWRKVITKIGNFLFSSVIGIVLTSYTTMFRCYKKSSVSNIVIENPTFASQTEIIAKLAMRNSKIKEIPAKLTTRIKGESKFNYKKEIPINIKLFLKLIKLKIQNAIGI